MIRHIVFFTAKDPNDRETVFSGLSLLKTNPHAAHFEVGRNFGTDTISTDAPDFVVYGEFEEQSDLDAFKEHETYAQAIAIVRPLRDMRIAADFLSEQTT